MNTIKDYAPRSRRSINNVVGKKFKFIYTLRHKIAIALFGIDFFCHIIWLTQNFIDASISDFFNELDKVDTLAFGLITLSFWTVALAIYFIVADKPLRVKIRQMI